MVTRTETKMTLIYPMADPQERLLIWEKARRVWGAHKWDAAKELKKMRKERERQLTART